MGKKTTKKVSKHFKKAEELKEEIEETNDQVIPLISNVAVACANVVTDVHSRTVSVDQLCITFYATEILSDASLKLHAGNRYGLLGPNGCGKSTLLKCIAAGEIPVPKNIDYYYVDKEVDASPTSALEEVLSVDKEKERLEAEAERLGGIDSPEAEVRLSEIYERLDALEADTAEMRAARILSGLGFNKDMQAKACKDYSGGWRMRISLAKGLFVNPTLLLLDEPSNHLDIEAVVWLEEFLKKFTGILLVISHSQDFLNNVCTNVMRMHKKKILYYKGGYDTYMRTRMEQEEHQMKRFNWEQDQIKHMQEYIRRFGHGSKKLARQAQSKEKTLAKMTRGGLIERVTDEGALTFYFSDPGTLSPPIIQFTDVAFGYPGKPSLYTKLNFGVDLDSRIALVGPNGAGKTTLQKLICGMLEPTDGIINRNGHVRTARFAQHFVDQLPFDISAINFIQKEFPDIQEIQQARQLIGRYGLTGNCQLQPIGTLSEGQKARVVFAMMAHKCPHLLMLDEPTNCLDMDTIDSLAEAILDFEGGVVLVSHDIRLISQVADEIWIVENGAVTPFDGDITAYKEKIKEIIEGAGEAYSKGAMLKQAEGAKASTTKRK